MSSSNTPFGRIAAVSTLAAALSLPVYAGVASAEPLSAPPGVPAGSSVGLAGLALAMALVAALVFVIALIASLQPAALAGPRGCPLCGSPRTFDGVCGSCGGRLAFSAAW